MVKNQKKTGARGAFTLIEILVVLVIMGFLVAMVAPKLAGIVDKGVDTACDTNQERLRKIINSAYALDSKLPAGLTNMVVATDANGTTAAVPAASDEDKTNGPEFLSAEFAERFKPQVYTLNADEAKELRGMGMGAVKMLAQVNNVLLGEQQAGGSTNIKERGTRQPVAVDLKVLMAGMGAATNAAVPAYAKGDTVTVAGNVATRSATPVDPKDATSENAQVGGTFAFMHEGKNIGRILLGVGKDGEMVQSGILDEAGTCPGQLQNADNFSWGNYVIVVPRLAATMDRMGEDTLHAVALNEKDDGTLEIVGRTPASGYEYFGAQKVTDFTTSCPEGHTWGASSDAVGISLK
ncbi:MAG: type II secretion system protein [Campylobacterales bacterium]|nr:type II secretion system protein [Campylobacterales bacterium]